MSQKRILVVDDEPDLREILQCNLENAGYLVDTAASAEEALATLRPDHALIHREEHDASQSYARPGQDCGDKHP